MQGHLPLIIELLQSYEFLWIIHSCWEWSLRERPSVIDPMSLGKPFWIHCRQNKIDCSKGSWKPLLSPQTNSYFPHQSHKQTLRFYFNESHILPSCGQNPQSKKGVRYFSGCCPNINPFSLCGAGAPFFQSRFHEDLPIRTETERKCVWSAGLLWTAVGGQWPNVVAGDNHSVQQYQ